MLNIVFVYVSELKVILWPNVLPEACIYQEGTGIVYETVRVEISPGVTDCLYETVLDMCSRPK